MKPHFDIPPQLRHLKLDERGYPIPFFAPIVDGKPNFRFQDDHKRDICLQKKLCPICGQKLYKDFTYQVTGPEGLKNGISSDAMMHKVCAEFTLQACPHIHFGKAERKEEVTNPTMVVNKPNEIYLVRASKWEIQDVHVESPGKGILETPAAPIRVRLIKYKVVSAEKYIYENNVLVKAPPDDIAQ